MTSSLCIYRYYVGLTTAQQNVQAPKKTIKKPFQAHLTLYQVPYLVSVLRSMYLLHTYEGTCGPWAPSKAPALPRLKTSQRAVRYEG